MTEGLGSSLFAVALAFTVVVMYDAMGVRRHAGEDSIPIQMAVEFECTSYECILCGIISIWDPLKYGMPSVLTNL